MLDLVKVPRFGEGMSQVFTYSLFRLDCPHSIVVKQPLGSALCNGSSALCIEEDVANLQRFFDESNFCIIFYLLSCTLVVGFVIFYHVRAPLFVCLHQDFTHRGTLR